MARCFLYFDRCAFILAGTVPGLASIERDRAGTHAISAPKETVQERQKRPYAAFFRAFLDGPLSPALRSLLDDNLIDSDACACLVVALSVTRSRSRIPLPAFV
jgi:hypothetical protein